MKCIRCGAELGDRPSCSNCGAARPETVSAPRAAVREPAREEAPTIPELFGRPEEGPAPSPSPRAHSISASAPPSPQLPFPEVLGGPASDDGIPTEVDGLAAVVLGEAPRSADRPTPRAEAPPPAGPVPRLGRDAHPIPVPAAVPPKAVVAPRARPTPGPVVQIRMAGFWRRGLATLIDLALVAGLVLLVLKIGIGSLDLAALPKSPLWGVDYLVYVLLQHPDRAWPIVFFGISTLFGYLFLFQAIVASTPGKLLLKMRIVGPQGKKIGPIRAFARTLAYGVSASFFMMGFLWAAFDLERRALHDVLSGSYVIVPDSRDRKASSPAVPAKRRAAA